MKLLLALLLCSAPAYGVNPDRMLYALAAVETQHNPAAIGAAGERSQWQLTAAVWREYTREPFSKATSSPVLARMVARAHVQRIVQRVQRSKLPSPYSVARGWNPGGGAEYAQRVSNIYNRSK